ncbi:MAG: MazG nucleotide pyrophosphohydrolase domain-containing protein, partial [Chlamydiota bacterium]
MKEMDDLLEITTTLIEPGGCPWDAQQTLRSLQKYFLEEVHEVVEAIDRDDAKNMSEELGDVFYLILFAAKIAEKQQLFSIQDVISEQKEKLIRRHPHVFSKEKSDSSLSIEELEAKWDAIK